MPACTNDEFIGLEPCPDCESQVTLDFTGDGVALVCTGCGRRFGRGYACDEAYELCDHWNRILRRHR